MPLTSKQNTRQTASPSPTPGDLLSTLLLLKDTVNTTLLTELTRRAELTAQLCEVEDQLRDAVEQAIKSLKNDTDKRKRKISPGIKKLEDCLKSLSKSEARCKGFEKGCKNADAKKAKRRIKDAQKVLQEFASSDIEFGISTLVVDQITILCQRLMQIPSKLTLCNDVQAEKSDSDSEAGFGSRTNTPTNNIYAEIELHRSFDSPHTTPRHSLSVSPSGKHEKISSRPNSRNEQHRNSPVQRLNSVVLFSSESDEEQIARKHDFPKHDFEETGTHRSRKNRHEHEQKHKRLPGNADYEILNKPTHNDIFRTGYSSSHLLGRRRSPSPIIFDDYESPVKHEHESLQAPITEYLRRMSPSMDKDTRQDQTKTFSQISSDLLTDTSKSLENVHVAKLNEISPSSSKSTPKRLLPAVPRQNEKHVQNETSGYTSFSPSKYSGHYFRLKANDVDNPHLSDTADTESLSTALNTVELLNEAEDFLKLPTFGRELQNGISSNAHYNEKMTLISIADAQNTQMPTRESKVEPDYIDIEEVEFRESVSSARRQIMNRLKSKYSHSTNTASPEPNFEQTSQLSSVYPSTQSRVFDANENTSMSSRSEDRRKNDANINDSQAIISTFDNVSSKSFQLPYENKTDQTVKRKVMDDFTNMLDSKSHCNVRGVYKSKLIHINKSDYNHNHQTPESNPDDSVSIVYSAIQKFESASKDQKFHQLYNTKPKYRSSSEPRRPVTALQQTNLAKAANNVRKPDLSKASPVKSARYNAALQPRNGPNTSVISNMKTEQFNSTAHVNGTLNLNKSCTENDLLNLVSNESSSSIRKQWSRRRSSSMTPKVPERNIKQSPVYEPWTSFQITEQFTRCFISAIVALDDRNLVALDELNGFLHLFDATFKHRHQFSLAGVPRNCVKVKPQEIAVAFPYKKRISTYFIQSWTIISCNDVHVPCLEWIVDMAFSKDKFFVICKAGQVHVLQFDGQEVQRTDIGLTGRLFLHPTGTHFFVLAENRVTKFDIRGTVLSTKPDIDAYSMIILENRIYVADRQKHKLLPLTDSVDVLSLTEEKIEFPSAVCSSIKGDLLFISQYDESMDLILTRTIRVFKQRRS